eukprot:1225374-Rhodomonas_salina.1
MTHGWRLGGCVKAGRFSAKREIDYPSWRLVYQLYKKKMLRAKCLVQKNCDAATLALECTRFKNLVLVELPFLK